jgi:xanthine dehydrogenase YagS FAD-binding subunit
MKPFAFVRAQSVAEAAASASTTVAAAMIAQSSPSQDVLLKAGGIDLLDLMKEGLAPQGLIDLRHVPDLDGVTDTGASGLRIGPLLTLAKLSTNALVQERYTALGQAAGGAASPQIRNVATLGGNLFQRPRCWYFRSHDFHCLRKGGGHCFAINGENQYHALFDNHVCAIVHPSTLATALVALGASVELTNASGNVRTLLLESFLLSSTDDVHRENDLQPQEVLTAVQLPLLSGSTRSVHLKQGAKDSFDWPLAEVAVVIDRAADGRCRRAAVVLGAAAPVPHRAKATEAFLTDAYIDERVAADAAKRGLDGATPLAHNAYKIPLFEALVRRAIVTAVS